MPEYLCPSNWESEWVQALLSFFAVSVALAMPFYLARKQRLEEQVAHYARETVALQALYPEMHQLKMFFLAVELHIARREVDSLKRIANGESDMDPSVPSSIADGRFEIVTYLSTKLSGAYSIALARRHSALTSLAAILKNERHTSNYGGAPVFDFEKASDSMRLVISLCGQGGDACEKLTDEAERRDASLRVVGVKPLSKSENR